MAFKAGAIRCLGPPWLGRSYEGGRGLASIPSNFKRPPDDASRALGKRANTRIGPCYYRHRSGCLLYSGAYRYWDLTENDMAETFQGRVIIGRADAESLAIQVLNFIVADVD